MTFYQQQILSIKESFIPKDYLCEQIIQAKNFIDKNFSGDINLDKIASEACLSKYHFLRLFKLLYGRTPHRYLTEVRIEQAKQFLSNGLPVPETCFLVGFNSISSFKELFKRCTRLTPSLYRQQLKQKKEISQTAYRFLPFFFSLQKSNFQDG